MRLLDRWPIRDKLLVGIALLLITTGTLAASGLHSVYAYRSLARSLRSRATELPVAHQLQQQVTDLRVWLAEQPNAPSASTEITIAKEPAPAAAEFAAALNSRLTAAEQTLSAYREHLLSDDVDNPRIKDSSRELETAGRIGTMLTDLKTQSHDAAVASEARSKVTRSLAAMQQLTAELPGYLYERMQAFAGEVRGQYRAMIFINWVTLLAGLGLLGLLIKLFYDWVFRPLRLLVKGSRCVAAGDYGHRVRLTSRDEMAELADAFNEMTAQFQDTRDDLDRQVQERTKQVVRSEQLASVGFLAAGIAHEINNPLASIAMCAESLESRIDEIAGEADNEEAAASRKIAKQYLRMIQDEAFRCKGITGRLLDFSRLGDLKRSPASLGAIVSDVVGMLEHLGKHTGKRILVHPPEPVLVSVNPQEIKQVVLNLIVNALDAVEDHGVVEVRLARRGRAAELSIRDDGCGMNEEVLQHLFEPFFTRRRSGQGTGLGLSITYRIVADHGGQIEAESEGPGQGSTFRVTLPLVGAQQEVPYRAQAA